MRRLTLIWLACLVLCSVSAQEDYQLTHVIEDIYSTVIEDGGDVDFEEMQEQLMQLHAQKININQATHDDLQGLYFLSDEQIDRILVYRDEHPLHSVYEVQLIPGLREWEYRFLALFIEAGPTEKPKIYVRDLFKNAHHEVDLRLDARSIENNLSDPVYTSLKYRFNSMHTLSFGLTAKHDVGTPWWGPKNYVFDYYGGYVQLNNIGHLKTAVIGDYRANFGLGLVVSGQMRMGKTAYIDNLNYGSQGLKKYGGTGGTTFFRGAGATVNLGPVDASAWYSCRYDNAVWQHVVGLNASYNWKNLRVGLTATESLFSDTFRVRHTYYNTRYFEGKRQAVIGAYAFYHYKLVSLFGEVAVAQNTQWGVGALLGTKVLAGNDINILAIGRYYSPWFDNRLASAFGETTRNNDELGLYTGAEFLNVREWRFGLYTDIFRFFGPKYGIRDTIGGFEVLSDVAWMPKNLPKMELKFRWKRKKSSFLNRWQGRYLISWQTGGWQLETSLHGTLCNYVPGTTGPRLTFGYAVMQDVHYHFSAVPIVLQFRAEWFDAQNWNNRIYAYENDVLYAFSIPATYGQGARMYLNARYKINSHFSLYLNLAETIYTPAWMKQRSLLRPTRTDAHLLLRITY